MTKRSVLKYAVGGCGPILVVQFVTYMVFSARATVDTFVELSPATSHCPAVCCSCEIQREFQTEQLSRLEQLLRIKYQVVYARAHEIPDPAWVLDCEGDVCSPVQLRGVCLVSWSRNASGPFWFRATFSSWHGPGARVAVDEIYVWGLFKWVRVKSTLVLRARSGTVWSPLTAA